MFQQSYNFFFISANLFFICLNNDCVAAMFCYSSWMNLHPDYAVRTSPIQYLDSKNILKIRWWYVLPSHLHLVVQVCDGLLRCNAWGEWINSWQDYPLTCSVSCTARSPGCMFWMQVPYLAQVMLLSCSRIPCSQVSQPDYGSKPPDIPSVVRQQRSTHLLSCDTFCRHTSVMWRGVWVLQTPEKSTPSF